jgi:hypothetical protein
MAFQAALLECLPFFIRLPWFVRSTGLTLAGQLCSDYITTLAIGTALRSWRVHHATLALLSEITAGHVLLNDFHLPPLVYPTIMHLIHSMGRLQSV